MGGFIVSALSEGAKAVFTTYITSGTYQSIYGAFATLPVFLLWVYVSWWVTLFGAAIAATLPMLRLTRFADEARAGNRFLTAVALLFALYESHRAACRTSHSHARAGGARLEDDVDQLLSNWSARLRVAASDRRRDTGRLFCDPYTTDVVAVFRRLGVDPDNSLVTRDAGGVARLDRRRAVRRLAAATARGVAARRTGARERGGRSARAG